MISKTKFEYIRNPIFVSYTSLSDFLKCPRSYYLKNIYRNNLLVKEGEKVHEPFRLQIASPYLSLGSVVHDTIKWYLDMKGQLNKNQIMQKYENLWLKFTGKRGGFLTYKDEQLFKLRGLNIIDNFLKNTDKLGKSAPAVNFPRYNLLENIILIGNFDFVEEKEDRTLHVIDFKTGANDEKDTIQLYIYAILAEANLGKSVSAASFWYLDRDNSPKPIVLDALKPKLEWLMEKSKELKEAIDREEWVCIKANEMCNECKIYQAIIDGKGQFQFSDFKYKKDVYYLPK